MTDPAAFGQLGRNVVVFGRVLRAIGIAAPPDRVILLSKALETVGLGKRGDAKAAARSVFARSPEEARRVDAVFDAFWRAGEVGASGASEAGVVDDGGRELEGRPSSQREPGPVREESVARLDAARGHPDAESNAPPARDRVYDAMDGDRAFTYSFSEGLYQKDLTQLTPTEMEFARNLTKRQAWDLGRRITRRMRRGRGGDRFDARRTLRGSLRRGGEVLSLSTRAQKSTQRDLVLLCDVSGSMDRYSRLLLQFIHTVRHAVGRVEAFVFGTRLTRITHEIRHRSVTDAVDEVSRTVSDWAGGTRIGECLRTFNRDWARRVLSRGAIVLIVSDGWDRGDINLLAREMQRLQRSAYRLIWLNPLLGSANFRPQTVGMQAAVPFIDDFLPAHNLKNLEQLATLLRSVEHHRPTRAQGRKIAERAR